MNAVERPLQDHYWEFMRRRNEYLEDPTHGIEGMSQVAEHTPIPLGDWIQARRLCSDVDEKDTPFIALTIHLNARLWTEDAELKRGLRAKGFDHFFEP